MTIRLTGRQIFIQSRLILWSHLSLFDFSSKKFSPLKFFMTLLCLYLTNFQVLHDIITICGNFKCGKMAKKLQRYWWQNYVGDLWCWPRVDGVFNVQNHRQDVTNIDIAVKAWIYLKLRVFDKDITVMDLMVHKLCES